MCLLSCKVYAAGVCAGKRKILHERLYTAVKACLPHFVPQSSNLWDLFMVNYRAAFACTASILRERIRHMTLFSRACSPQETFDSNSTTDAKMGRQTG